MKKLSLGFLVLMSLVIASCGGDNKSGDGGRGSSHVNLYANGQEQHVTGYIHFSPQTANIFVANVSNTGNNYQNGSGNQSQVQFQIQDNMNVMSQAFMRKFGSGGVAQNQQYSVTIRGVFYSNGSMGTVQVRSAVIH